MSSDISAYAGPLSAIGGSLLDLAADNHSTTSLLITAVIFGVIDGVKPRFVTKAPWLRNLVAGVVSSVITAWVASRKPKDPDETGNQP